MKKSLIWIYIDFILFGFGIKVIIGILFYYKCFVIEVFDIIIWLRCFRIGMNIIR